MCDGIGAVMASSKGMVNNAGDQDAAKGRPALSRDSREQASPTRVSSFLIDSLGNLQPCDVDEAISRDGGESYWIDAAVYNERDAEELHNSIIDRLDLSPWLQKHLSNPKQLRTPQVLTLSTSTLIVVRVLPAEKTSREIEYAVALCLKGLLLTVTMHPDNSKAAKAAALLSQSTLSYMQQTELPENSTSGAIVLWMIYRFVRVSHALEELRTQILRLQNDMEENVATVDHSRIINLKDELFRVIAVAEDQLQCVEGVAQSDSVISGVNLSKFKGSFGVLHSTATSTERTALRLENTLNNCGLMYDAHQQKRINHHLAILTMLSAVFMPMQLLAGVWGMNFVNMPELERENGYYFALMSMTLVAIILVSLFFCLGWFN